MEIPNGWGMTHEQLNKICLLEHLADTGVYPTLTTFPSWAQELGSEPYLQARRDVADFEARGMLDYFETGAMPSLSLSAIGLAEVERLRERRNSRRARTSAIRDALLYWLDDETAQGQPEPLFDEFPQTNFGEWFGEPFTDREISNGLDWLESRGYISAAARTDELGIVRPRLSSNGQAVVDRGGSVSDDSGQVATPAVNQVVNHFGPNSQVQQGNVYANMTVTGQVTADQRASALAIVDLIRSSAASDELLEVAEDLEAAAQQSKPGVLRRGAQRALQTVGGSFLAAEGTGLSQQLHHLIGALS